MLSCLFGAATLSLSILEFLYAFCLGYWWPYATFNKTTPINVVGGETVTYPADEWGRTDAVLAFSCACIMTVVFVVVGVNYLLRKGRHSPVALLIVISLFGVGVAIATIVSSIELRDAVENPDICVPLVELKLGCIGKECAYGAFNYCTAQTQKAINTIIFTAVVLFTRTLSVLLFIAGIFLTKRSK